MDDKEQNLRILEKMMEQLNAKSSFEKFVKDFEVVIKIFREMKDNNDKERTELSDLFFSLQNSTEKDFADLKQALLEKINAKLATLKDGKDGRDGQNGKDADEEKITQKVLSQVPKIEEVSQKVLKEIEKELPKLGEPIRDALELLKDDDRLDKKAIRGLEEELEKLRKYFEDRLSNVSGRLGGGGFSVMAMEQHLIDNETPTGTVNGVNTDFTISNRPSPTTSLKVYVNGQRMKLTEDYTFSGVTITFNTAPPEGSIITCDFRI